jgi:hypothetical protein
MRFKGKRVEEKRLNNEALLQQFGNSSVSSEPELGVALEIAALSASIGCNLKLLLAANP